MQAADVTFCVEYACMVELNFRVCGKFPWCYHEGVGRGGREGALAPPGS